LESTNFCIKTADMGRWNVDTWLRKLMPG